MIKDYQKAYFIKSVATANQLPPDQGMEVAIVGRSNAGKSSVLNCFTRNKHLARVSKTPGRTQLINFFGLDENRRLVDLPGYGYAKVPPSIKAKWQEVIQAYFSNRQSLRGLLLIMDCRHPLKPGDEELLSFAQHFNLPIHIILNKVDKLSKNESINVLKSVQQKFIAHTNPAVTAQLFSALKKQGLAELHKRIDGWYGFDKD
jgi:GTP-binding protein